MSEKGIFLYLIPKAPISWDMDSLIRFKNQSHKMQVFVYLKYNMKYCKRFIMRNMFMSKNTYYKYNTDVRNRLKNGTV